MGEAWRRKTYYDPRVLIDVERVLTPQYGDSMLCITGAQLELLRNLTQYLHRRSSFADEYHTDYYLCADNEDWDALQAIVADLEETLMGCEEITASLDDIASQLACLCSAANRAVTDGAGLGPIIDGYLTDGTLIPSDVYGATTAEENERCALAQLVFWQSWQVVANLIGPLDELAIDLLMPALVGLLGTLAGGPVVGIPLALLVMAVRGLVEAKVGGMLDDLLSTWEDAEEDVICAIYVGLETGYREAERLAMEVIMALPSTGLVQKWALHCLVCPWAIMAAKEAYDNESDFAVENVTPGYCVDCNEVEGSDWWALYLPMVDNTVHLSDDGGTDWVSGCWEYALPAGWVTNGVVLEVKNKVGACTLKRMGSAEAGCDGSELWGNTSPNLADGLYFCVNGTSIDEAECKAALCPEATTYDNTYTRTGALTINAGFHWGYRCEGSADIHVKYLVMQGSPP